MTTVVHTYHNIATDPQGRRLGFFGYEPGHPVVLVAVHESERPTSHTVIGEAWDLYNIGHDIVFGMPDNRAVKYRVAGNRSLSVGDVVEIIDHLEQEGTYYSLDEYGWSPIERPHIVDLRGTTPYNGIADPNRQARATVASRVGDALNRAGIDIVPRGEAGGIAT